MKFSFKNTLSDNSKKSIKSLDLLRDNVYYLRFVFQRITDPESVISNAVFPGHLKTDYINIIGGNRWDLTLLSLLNRYPIHRM